MIFQGKSGLVKSCLRASEIPNAQGKLFACSVKLCVLIFKLLKKNLEEINSSEQSVSHRFLSTKFNVRFVF